jgi:hypothetical protein
LFTINRGDGQSVAVIETIKGSYSWTNRVLERGRANLARLFLCALAYRRYSFRQKSAKMNKNAHFLD